MTGITDIIWDFDGTLYDTYPSIVRAMLLMLEGRGIREEYDVILAKMKVSLGVAEEYVRENYGLSREESRSYKEYYAQADWQRSQPFPGAKALVARIAAEGRRNHLYTHSSYTCCRFFQRDGMLGDFSSFYTSDLRYPHKPDPAALHALLGAFDIPRENALMIGDRSVDILAGRNAGIRTCFFDPTGARCEEADVQVDSMEVLEALLFSLR